MTVIPFNRPSFGDAETENALRVLRGGHASGDGVYTKACHAFLESRLAGTRAFLTTSCTHALEMAAVLLDIGSGDEVIVPSFTFVSTANAFLLRRATIRFCDVEPATMNMDPSHLETLVSVRTRVVVPVHYAGVGCDMQAIGKIANQIGAHVVEDNAHGLFGSYRGQPLGTFGSMSTNSFHETKNVSCGEGGALCVNDSSYVERAEIVREKGTNRSRFFRGQVDKYTWVDVGSSYLASDVLAGVLAAQFERADDIQRQRQSVWERYDAALAGWAATMGVARPCVPLDREQAYHMYFLLMPNLESRTRFIQHLRDRSIHAAFHYQALHLSPLGRQLGGCEGLCPISEAASDRLVRLPFYTDLSEPDQDRVIEAVLAFAS